MKKIVLGVVFILGVISIPFLIEMYHFGKGVKEDTDKRLKHFKETGTSYDSMGFIKYEEYLKLKSVDTNRKK